MLRSCLLFSACAVVALSVAAAVSDGVAGVASVVSGASIVVVFSGITLLIGHIGGSNDRMFSMTLFILAYGVKIVGFGTILLAVGRPPWLVPGWFLAAALVTVLAWQAAELKTFAASRHTLYTDTDDQPERI